MKTYEELMYELEEKKAMSVLQRRKMGIRMRKMMMHPVLSPAYPVLLLSPPAPSLKSLR